MWLFACQRAISAILPPDCLPRRWGFPWKRFIAANNRNDIFYGICKPAHTLPVLPSPLQCHGRGRSEQFRPYHRPLRKFPAAITADISGATYTDEQIRETVAQTWRTSGYLLDPHGACGYRALSESLQPVVGIFLETAHPRQILGDGGRHCRRKGGSSCQLQAFMKGEEAEPADAQRFRLLQGYLLSL